jgi:hypothetical protein
MGDETDDRRARLRRRIAGGVFTALLAVHGLAAEVAQASEPRGEDAAVASVGERAQQVRAAIGDVADETNPGLAWGNGWFNWKDGWNNWRNWRNGWNNWSNAWNNWNNWNNAWYNF